MESYSYPDSMYTDWYSEPMNTGPDWTDTEEERAEKEEKLAELAQDTFFPRLEKVIGLTKAARGRPDLEDGDARDDSKERLW